MKKSYTAEELKQVNPVNLLSALSILDPSFKMVENNLDGSNPNVIPDFKSGERPVCLRPTN